jgi:hypothetical protein
MAWTTPGAGGAGGGGSGTSGGGEIVPLVVESHTAGDTLTAAEDGSVHNNTGATGAPAARALTLPAAAAGLRFTLMDSAGTGLTITAAAGDVIRVDVGRTAIAGSITSTAIGDAVELIAIDGTTWIGRGQVGEWLINSQGITQSLRLATGSVDFGTAPAGMLFEWSDPFSVEYWFSSVQSAADALPISKGLNAGNFTGWYLSHDSASDNIQAALINDTSPLRYMLKEFYVGAGELKDGRWHHVVATFDGSGLAAGSRIYFDGAELTNNTTIQDALGGNTILAAGASLAWGKRDLSGLPFNGYGSNLAIYDVALTADNVLERFSDGTLSDPNLASFGGLVGSWQMSNNDGATITDRTGAITGTLAGTNSFISSIPPDGKHA